MDILKKNQEEMLELKDSVIETKNDFDRFLSRLDTTEERSSEPEVVSMEMSKTEKHREKLRKVKQNIQEL